MKPRTIKTFKPDMMKAVNSEQKNAGQINNTSVKFEYSGGAMLLLRTDGNSDYLGSKTTEAISTQYP